ncbi:tetratricopeptide repeat protein [Tautonia plasticadhaerens]|uniref:tetratricopeptide repeat protein n=1 Tax=Tautonia plasticadhaerens TaxID=2527974 RepID=UPI0018D23A65|nr:tetratricopeptide repeat protein [Tautonia plasticadhaerens]
MPNLPGGGGNRPNLPGGGGDRPNFPGGVGNRPNFPDGGGNRPNFPGGGDRPIIGGGGDRPNLPNRPGGGGDRPIIGGGNNRPIIGGGNDRPVIGSGNNRPVIGSGNTTNNLINNNQNNIAWNNDRVNVNRPGWGWGGGSWGGGWGGGANRWAGSWYNNYVPPRYHGWYHGSWSNPWASAWYVPLAYGATSWALNGLSGWTSGYYDTSYVNPYYVAPVEAAPVYDYGQPIVVQTYAPQYVSANGGEAAPDQAQGQDQPPPPSPGQQQAYGLFDQARAAFASNDDGQAIDLIEQALRLSPGDPVMHEFRALCLFALGDYTNAAAVLNALLAVAPGWDWTTMSSLYGNASTYTDQLRNLESYCKQHPDDPASHFVLAYHYLILGHDDQAAAALRVVTARQPEDAVSARMLQALTDASQPPAAATGSPGAAAPASPPAEAPSRATGEAGSAAPAADEPTTDLVGRWKAEPSDRVGFALTIGEDGTYSWVVSPTGAPPTSISGAYGVDGDTLILKNEEQGDLVGQAVSGGPDRFTLRLVGAPPGDPGLTFDRVADGAP